jgi:phosphoribosylformylglycinamidine synthase subunit PurQ / glutaminase
LKAARDRDLVWLEYKENPNGSIADIAGITNAEGNVAGLMPHPERAVHEWMGGSDGRKLLEIWS